MNFVDQHNEFLFRRVASAWLLTFFSHSGLKHYAKDLLAFYNMFAVLFRKSQTFYKFVSNLSRQTHWNGQEKHKFVEGSGDEMLEMLQYNNKFNKEEVLLKSPNIHFPGFNTEITVFILWSCFKPKLGNGQTIFSISYIWREAKLYCEGSFQILWS